ncbi:MAG: hypothetical protein ACLGH8_00980 [Bacteroidia bacterium]
MGTQEMKNELHNIIEREDVSTLAGIYGLVKNYVSLNEEEKAILEAEMDIAAGNIYSHEEVKVIIESWTKAK